MKPFKIFWAFDPYAEMKDTWMKTVQILKILKREKQADVQPIYFFGHELMLGLPDTSAFTQADTLKPIIGRTMEKHLKDAGAGEFLPPAVILSSGTSRRKDIDFMADYLRDERCDLLVLNTHARKGLKRWYMGSFAENALLKLEVPMLFISPHTQDIKSFERMFYPTDFSKKGLPFFETFLEEGVFSGKEIVFYSKVISPVNTAIEASAHGLGGGWVSVEHLLRDIAEERRKDAGRWVALAEERGFHCEVIIDEAHGIFADDLLRTIEEKRVDLVVMPSFVTKLETILVGSLTRQVIRHTKVPVLVRHYRES